MPLQRWLRRAAPVPGVAELVDVVDADAVQLRGVAAMGGFVVASSRGGLVAVGHGPRSRPPEHAYVHVAGENEEARRNAFRLCICHLKSL